MVAPQGLILNGNGAPASPPTLSGPNRNGRASGVRPTPPATDPAPSKGGVAEAEAWMRARFPGVLGPGAGRIFQVGKYGICGFASEYLVAACLGRAGSPDAPWKYDQDAGEYLRYDPQSGLYRPERPEAVENAVVRVLEQCARESGSTRPERIRALQKRRHIRPVVEALKGVSPISAADFERHDAACIHVKNGILDLERLELQDFSPDRPARFGLPVEWDPSPPRPRRFLRFLKRMFPDPADRRLAIRLLAMALLGNPYQKVAIIHGASRSGKSTLVKLFATFVGDDAYGQLRLEHSGGRFEAARWIGKLILAQLDAPEEILQANTHVLKAISGQDRQEAELKGVRKTVRFVPRALPIITSNLTPRLKLEDDRDAWLNRLVILHTEAGPAAAPVRDFDKVLVAEEGSGILGLVAREAKRLLEAGTLKLTRAQQHRIELMVDASDPIRTFVRHFVEPAHGESLYTADAYEATKAFLRRHRYEPIPEGRLQRSFREAMMSVHGARRSNSLTRSPGKSTKGWRHFRLCDDC